MDKIRAEFESWASPILDLKASRLRAGRYLISETQAAWEAWQAAIPDPCDWIQDEWDNSYDTSCGNKYEIIDGTPEENGMNFCTYCGGKLEAITGEARTVNVRRAE